jgi:predicted TIM-barrel fold metal-dependent hydrolase
MGYGCCGYTRRDLLRAGSLTAAGLLVGAQKLSAQVKKGKRIDVHGHVWTDQYLDLMDKYGKKDTNIQRGKEAGISEAEMSKRFAVMDATGVEMQVLSICPQAPNFEDKSHAVDAAKRANDLYAETVQKWPKRFMAYAALPLPHVDEALKELDRGLSQLKFVGVTMTTFVLDKSLGDPLFAPIYEEINRRKGVLYIHPSGNGVASPFVSAFKLTWEIGAPMEDTVSVLHLISKGVPQRYPNMRIINSHLGGMLPMVYQRLDNQYTWENPLPEKPSITAKRMWYDTVGHGWPPALRAAVDSMGADHIVLGTDFPYESGELFKRAINYVSDAGLKQSDIDKILDQNAAAVLGVA